MYYRGAGVAIVVFDITETDTFVSLNSWLEELRSNVEKEIPLVVCGNKTDLDGKRTVSFDEARSVAGNFGATYLEASAKTGVGVDLVFQAAVMAWLKTQPSADVLPAPVRLETGRAESKKCC
jgi:GTPase SAR1 family protein